MKDNKKTVGVQFVRIGQETETSLQSVLFRKIFGTMTFNESPEPSHLLDFKNQAFKGLAF
jgi:hypothetical protein